MRRFFFVSLLCASAAAAQSCGSSSTSTTPASSGTDAGATTSDPNDAGYVPLGGAILFRGLGEGLFLAVQLYQFPIRPRGMPVLGDGHCDIHASGEGDAFDSAHFFLNLPSLDLGANVTATNGPLTITAPAHPGTFQYENGSTVGLGFGTTFTLTSSGSPTGVPASTFATFRVPGRVNQGDASSPVVTNSGPITIKYGGGDGAQSFHISILSATNDIDCYPAPNTTSFTLPPSVTSKLDATFTPQVWAESVTFVTIAGRNVLLRVTSDNLD